MNELTTLQINNIHYFIKEELSTADKENKKYVREVIRGLADIPLIDQKQKRELLDFVNEEWKRVTKEAET